MPELPALYLCGDDEAQFFTFCADCKELPPPKSPRSPVFSPDASRVPDGNAHRHVVDPIACADGLHIKNIFDIPDR
jgi:hypothetical protein